MYNTYSTSNVAQTWVFYGILFKTIDNESINFGINKVFY